MGVEVIRDTPAALPGQAVGAAAWLLLFLPEPLPSCVLPTCQQETLLPVSSCFMWFGLYSSWLI